jgi:hypothetical protein
MSVKNTIVLIITLTIISLLSCNNSGSNATSGSETNAIESDKLYFDFTIDDKEIHIKEEDVLTSYNEIGLKTGGKRTVFKIMAGNYGEVSLVLTTPKDMTKPSSTPSGSTNFDEEITQGSVSLQGFPEKGYTFNNFETTYPERAIPVADAIVITSSERMGDEGRIITGTIKTKVFGGDNSKNDPNIKDRIIIGKFRVKHTFRDIKF